MHLMGRWMGEFVTVEDAMFDVLTRIHETTDCGFDGQHWSECEAVTKALGFESFDYWAFIHDQSRLIGG